MDPNANLHEQRRLVALLLANSANGDDAATRLAELCDALDEWLQDGGALPRAWERK